MLRPASLLLSLLILEVSQAQTIGTFSSIAPTAQTQQLVLPPTHTFQRIIRSGDPIASGGVLGNNLDFTGYVPISGSSSNGYLSISSETAPAQVAILDINFNASSKLWNVSNSGKVPFPQADIGLVAAFCSGTVTQQGTVMVCEEADENFDTNGDGYQDIGWVVEINPATRTVINQDGVGGVDKLWAMGRQKHENVAINAAQTIVYWGGDANPTGYLYKYVPSAAANFVSGSLYVLQTTSALGTGTWQLLNNSTKADLNNTVSQSTAAGAYNFNGIEDVEIGPDGTIYFAAKGPGVVYRLRDNGSTVSELEVFVASTNYDVDGTGPFAPEPWGLGNDNLAFDNEGNLWVLQDGTRNHIWVVGPGHTSISPNVRLFATTPAGSEPTGITFTPDNRFMFLSFMHPSTSNTQTQTDAAGTAVVFNTHTTVVVARKEFLGQTVTPVRFLSFEVKRQGSVAEISWSVDRASGHDFFEVQRSVDGKNFKGIGKITEAITDAAERKFQFVDRNPEAQPILYYRIAQVDKNGAVFYTSIKKIEWISTSTELRLSPVPANQHLTISWTELSAGPVTISLVSASGNVVRRKNLLSRAGNNSVIFQTGALPPGEYSVLLSTSTARQTRVFIKL